MTSAAHELRRRLGAIGLTSFCKTTGGKGLHVVAPLVPEPGKVRWDEAKTFAQLICRQMADDEPSRYLINMAKARRHGRIFLDYLRNDRMSTAVAVLSPRARAGAPVSMPVAWGEVDPRLDPKRFTVHSVPALISRSRAWRDYADAASPLSAAIGRTAARVPEPTAGRRVSSRPQRRRP